MTECPTPAPRADLKALPEVLPQGHWRLKLHEIRNFLHWQRRGLEQFAGSLQALIHQPLDQRHAGRFAEVTREGPPAHRRARCKVVYRSFELEERWLNASADTSREAHAREHTRLIGLLTELYMKMMDDDLHPCASIRHLLEDEFLPHIGASDRALLYRLAHGSDEDIERDDPPGAN